MGSRGDPLSAEDFMREALKEAEKALELGEVPIGAVIARRGEIIGRGHNRTETDKDPRAHAEMMAIGEAARALGGWRLLECSLYVTVEPCAMCAGAIVRARIPQVFIGVMDPKAGACGSLYNLLQDPRLNHRVEMETGLLSGECGQVLQAFFARLRRRDKQKKDPQQETGNVAQ
ncbi:MAG: tRNA adenosine(34) deaminase TadA [Bacillota bacterium]|nr:tRNA adenosine(34) deaminase TadA [Bacillota bacterium]